MSKYFFTESMKSRLKQLEFIWYEELLISNELRAYCSKHYRKDEEWHCCKVKRTTSQSGHLFLIETKTDAGSTRLSAERLQIGCGAD